MRERLQTMAWGAAGMVLVGLIYIAAVWISHRYTEFVVMRQVVAVVACSNPTEAAKLGIACPTPQPVEVPASGNVSPAAPAVGGGGA